MKTAEERVKWIVENLAYVADPVDILTRNFKAFETEVRRNQKEKDIEILDSWLDFPKDRIDIKKLIMEADQ